MAQTKLDIAQTIYNRRVALGMTQKQLAVKSGVSQRMIEQYEQGRKDLNHASVSTVKQLAGAIGCSIEQLLR